MILTDAAITNALNQTVQQIREGNLEQAQAGLAVLEFHRLMRPTEDSREFGPERLHETGVHISQCIAALGLGDAENALAEAEAAVARWGQEGGEVRTPKIQGFRWFRLSCRSYMN